MACLKNGKKFCEVGTCWGKEEQIFAPSFNKDLLRILYLALGNREQDKVQALKISPSLGGREETSKQIKNVKEFQIEMRASKRTKQNEVMEREKDMLQRGGQRQP